MVGLREAPRRAGRDRRPRARGGGGQLHVIHQGQVRISKVVPGVGEEALDHPGPGRLLRRDRVLRRRPGLRPGDRPFRLRGPVDPPRRDPRADGEPPGAGRAGSSGPSAGPWPPACARRTSAWPACSRSRAPSEQRRGSSTRALRSTVTFGLRRDRLQGRRRPGGVPRAEVWLACSRLSATSLEGVFRSLRGQGSALRGRTWTPPCATSGSPCSRPTSTSGGRSSSWSACASGPRARRC